MKRTVYFDLIKVLAITMVCFYHVNGLQKNILDSLEVSTFLNYLLISSLSMCVPLFFMVNGALLLNRPLNLQRHARKTIKLLFITYAWAVIVLLILIPITGSEYTLKGFLRSVWTLERGMINYLWFLLALVSIYLIFPLIKLTYDQQQKTTFFYICAVFFLVSFGNLTLNSIINVLQSIFGFVYLTDDHFNFFQRVDPFGRYSYAFFYFSIGGYLALLIKEKKIQASNSLMVMVFVFALLLLFAYGCLMTLSHGKYYDTVFDGYYSLMTLAMSVSTFIFLSRITIRNNKVSKFVTIIGVNTLGIYILHAIFSKALTPYFRESSLAQNISVNIAYATLLVLLSLFLTILLKRMPLVSWLLRI